MVLSTRQMSVSCARWHRARTLEARLSRSRLALNLHLPAAQTVQATHFGGAPPCAARTRLLRSHRRRSARSSYCTLFNNHCVLSARSSVSQTRTGDVRRRYGSLRFGYRIRRRPAAERCTAGCDRGLIGVHLGNGLVLNRGQAIIKNKSLPC